MGRREAPSSGVIAEWRTVQKLALSLARFAAAGGGGIPALSRPPMPTPCSTTAFELLLFTAVGRFPRSSRDILSRLDKAGQARYTEACAA